MFFVLSCLVFSNAYSTEDISKPYLKHLSELGLDKQWCSLHYSCPGSTHCCPNLRDCCPPGYYCLPDALSPEGRYFCRLHM
uniref:Cysteine rich secreted protein n=1 Tax=Riptortus pedestris TaxID=329032 RepID=R4WDA8_RIPPE|nr:cysteine rich secreted protein [Riptortus pedestris]